VARKTNCIKEALYLKRYTKDSLRTVISFTCVPNNTVIIGACSPKPIGEISEGELVRGTNGLQDVNGKVERDFEGDMIQLKPQYLPPILFTPEHLIRVVEQTDRLRSMAKWKGFESSWKAAEQISGIIRGKCWHILRRFFVLVPKTLFPEEDVRLNFKQYTDCEASFNKARGRSSLYGQFLVEGKITDGFAELLGWFLADGNVSSSGIQISLDRKDVTGIDRVKNITRKLGLKPSVNLVALNCVKVTIPSKIFVRFFRANFYIDKTKIIPHFVFKLKKNLVDTFLKGYALGDGCITGKYLEIISTSREIIIGAQLLFLKLGKVPTFKMHHRKSELGGSDILYALGLRQNLRIKRHIEDDCYYYFPVKTVQRVHYKGKIDDIHTSEGLFLTPFVAHNSDPYQPREIREQLTRKTLEILLPTQHIIMILTKSNLAERDFPLLAQFKNARFGMTLTSTEAIPDEPFATPNPQRLETLKKAHDMGIETWASIEPWIPNVTFPEQILAASKEFVDFYILGAFRYEKRHGYPVVPPNFYEEEWLKIQPKFAEPDCPWGFHLKRELHPRSPYA